MVICGGGGGGADDEVPPPVVEAPLVMCEDEVVKRRFAIRSERFDFRIWADISLLRWVISRRLESREAFVGAMRWVGLLILLCQYIYIFLRG